MRLARIGSQRRLWLFGAAVAVAAGVIAFAFTRASQPTPPSGGLVLSVTGATAATAAPPVDEDTRTAPATATPVEGATTVTAATAALPATVELRIVSHPPDVEVWLGEQKLGTSGKPASLPRTSHMLRLTEPARRSEILSKPGQSATSFPEIVCRRRHCVLGQLKQIWAIWRRAPASLASSKLR